MSMKMLWASALVALAICPVVLAETRLNAGTTRWARAAERGRADVFFLGDSIVSYGTGGWSNGLAQAARDSVGLAGSGLLTAPLNPPFTWVSYTGARIWSGPPIESTQAGVPSLTPTARHYSVVNNFAFVGTGFDFPGLDPTKPIDWHVFATGTTPNAQLQATTSRRTISPYSATIVQTTPIQTLASGNEAHDYVFRFDGRPDPGDWTSFEFTSNSRDAAIHYTKLTHPNSKGIAVSGWGEGGGTAQTFRANYYNHPRFTTEARSTLYRSLVAGNSGLLNVAIAFGVNDATQYSPAVFRSHVEGLIADVRRDWSLAGLPANDLSFTLVSTYQVDPNRFEPQGYGNLSDFRNALDSIAAGDAAVSFIDMWQAGPTWQTALASGYLADAVHPSATGTRLYGNVLREQLMPAVGDTDIDGDIDFADLLTLAQHYGEASGSWRQGDFDGVNGVEFEDLLKFAQNYTNANLNRSFEADWALARSIVPEPAGLGVLFMLLGRRRRTVRACEAAARCR